MRRNWCVRLSYLLVLLAQTVFAQVVIGPERQLTLPELQPAAFDQRDAAAASDGSGWLIAWTSGQFSSIGNVIAATRIDSAGTVLDPSSIVIATGTVVGHPAIAFGVDRYLVAWATPDSIRARLISRDGGLSPSVQIASLSGGLAAVPPVVRAAWDGTRFLVAWTYVLDASFSRNRRSFALLDAHATALSLQTLSEGLIGFDFALAAGNGEFVIFDSAVDLSGAPTGNGYPSSIRGFRITDAGTKAGPIAIAAAATPVFSPRAAFDGREYLVVWSTNLGLPGQSVGARMSIDGAVTPIPPFYSGPGTVNTLTWTGREAIVTLSDQQRVEALRLDMPSSLQPIMTSALITNASDAAWNGQRLLVAINAAGDVYEGFLDSPPRSVALSPAHQEAPSMASPNDGDALVVWLESANAMTMPLHNGLSAADKPMTLGPALVAPVVAWSGREYLVVWLAPSLGVVGRRIDRQGMPIDAQTFVIASPASSLGRSGVSFDGENFIVAYEAGGGCSHGATLTQVVSRVSREGMVLDPKTTIGGRSCGAELSLASGPDGSMLAWNGPDGPSAAFITRGGVTPGPIRLSPTLTGEQLRVAWTGTQFIIADTTLGAIEWLTLSGSGTPNLHGSILQPTPANFLLSSSLTRLGDGALFVWSAGYSSVPDMFGMRLSADGFATGAPFAIANNEYDARITVAETGSGRAEVVYQRIVDFPSVVGLARIFLRDVDFIPQPPRHRAAR